MLPTRLASLDRIALKLVCAVTLPETLSVAADVALELFDAASAVVLRWDSRLEAFHVGAASGQLGADFQAMAGPDLASRPDELGLRAMHTSGIVESRDLASYPPSPLLARWASEGFKSAVAIPLAWLTGSHGALLLLWGEERSASGEERVLMETLGKLASAAITRALATEALEETLARCTQELAVARQGLEEAHRLKTEFVAIASHELRTPMTAIKGYAILLQEPDLLKDDQVDALRILGEQTDRLTRILDDLLDLATLESGRMPTKACDVAIPVVLGRTRALLSRNYPDRPIEIVTGPDDITVRTDSDKLEQILVNLVDNACKYSAAGTAIRIVARREGAAVEIRIHNEGPGLSEAERAVLFEKFQRLDRNRHQAGGTGLGLFITRQLVEHLGGRIGIESGEDEGVTAIFTLPDLPSSV